MTDPYKKFSTKKTPQSEPIPGSDQVKDSAGGYVWAVDDWTRLERFLILGSEGGTYYIKEQKLTADNAEAVIRCIKENGVRVVETVITISAAGSAPKNDPALFVLAMCAGLGDLKTRRAALASLHLVARIGTHLFHFAEYVEQFRGWGRMLKDAVAKWYNEKEPERLAFQVVKYQQRDGWSHRDLLRLAHPKPKTAQHKAIFKWITTGKIVSRAKSVDIIKAFEEAKTVGDDDAVAGLIDMYGLTREMIPTEHLKSLEVWQALLAKMPVMASVRNLGKMTSIGLLKPMNENTGWVVSLLTNPKIIEKSRVHPISVLAALMTYQQGKGFRGSLTWTPVPEIVEALNDAFYLAFGNLEPSGEKTCLAIDVSGSMSTSINGMPYMSCRAAAAAMAMVTARTEPNHYIMAFSGGFVPISITKSDQLDAVVAKVNLPFDRTDCAVPMLDAIKRDLKVQKFIIYTDSETWVGDIHPSQALDAYRQHAGIPAKLVVVGMESNGFSIADPNDAGMLDVVGFNTSAPQIIAEF